MPQSTSLDETSFAQTVLLEGLGLEMRDLVDRLCALDCGWRLLRFLNQNPNILMTQDDLAYRVDEATAIVQTNLHAMIKLGLMRQTDLAGITFFGMTKDAEARQTISDLCIWHDQWCARIDQVDRLINRGPKRIRIKEKS